MLDSLLKTMWDTYQETKTGVLYGKKNLVSHSEVVRSMYSTQFCLHLIIGISMICACFFIHLEASGSCVLE